MNPRLLRLWALLSSRQPRFNQLDLPCCHIPKSLQARRKGTPLPRER